MISIKDARVVFNAGDILESRALAGVSADIGAGEFVTVIGSNGAGKSTLLGAIAGDAPLSGGSVAIDGRDVTRLPAHRRARQVARVFQDPLAGTCAHLSVEENMALAAARGGQRGWRRAVDGRRRAAYQERLATLGLNLENRLQDPVGKLSGGQRQALSLIMATLSPARILLLDEHTAALDPRMAAFVLQLTRRLYEMEKLATLMVTHSMQSALDMGHRLIMLHAGRVLHDVSAQRLKTMRLQDLLDLFAAAANDVSDSLALG